MSDDLARVPRRRDSNLPADPSNKGWSDLAMAWHERARTRLRVLPGFVWTLAPGDLGATLSDEVPLEVASLQLAGFDEFGGCPALAGYRLAPLPAEVECLADR